MILDKNMNKFIKYVIFALIISALNVSTYYVFFNYVLSSIILSNIVAYSFSITVQFIINKRIVFKDQKKTNIKQIYLFLFVKLIAFIIDTIVLLICSKILLFSQLISKIIANCSTTISNYSLNNKMVFK